MDETTPHPAPGRLAAARAWAERYEGWLWAAVIAVVLVIQWPMIKGYYYRATNATPRESSIVWQTDLDAALLEARQTDRKVLVDFMADWCPPCIAMKHDVWPDPGVERAVAAGYVRRPHRRPLQRGRHPDGARAQRGRGGAPPGGLLHGVAHGALPDELGVRGL